MFKLKFAGVLLLSFFILTSCSIFTRLKEKLSSKKEDITTREDTKDVTSDEDMKFYNKYIEVMNKIQESGEKIYKDYMRDIPDPKHVTKSSLIIPVSLQMEVGNLERTIKEYKRSLLDGGELSKLKASGDMQNEIEGDLKSLLPAMDEYHNVSASVGLLFQERIRKRYVKSSTL